MPVNGRSWGFNVSEGDLIPLVVVHPQTGDPSPLQANTARAGRARISQAKRGGSTGPPDRSRHVTCGNDEAVSRDRAADRAGPRQPQHDASSSGKHSDSLPLLLASPAPQPGIPAQMTLPPS